jgi:hypothetical protein
MRLSHVIRYRYISTAVAVIIGVIYKITRSPNKLLKCISESLTLTNYVSDILQSLDIGLLTTKTKLRGLSPRANYTDRAAAAGRRS